MEVDDTYNVDEENEGMGDINILFSGHCARLYQLKNCDCTILLVSHHVMP